MNVDFLFSSRSVRVRDLASFSAYLAEFLHAGIPLLNALGNIEKQYPKPYFRQVLQKIISQVRQGEAFSSALRATPEIFDGFYTYMIQAAEAGGNLDHVLARLSLSLEKEMDLRSRVTQALAYPALVLIFGILTVVFLMTFMVPKIALIYQDFGGGFPWITRAVLALSAWFVHDAWILLLAGALLIPVLARKESRIYIDRFLLSIPWMGKICLRSECARFSRTLGMLLESGVPLLESLSLARQTVINQEIQKRLGGIESQVKQGEALSESLSRRNLFEALMLNFVVVGESTGTLAASFQKLGEMSEKQADAQIKMGTTLLEPLIIIVVGVIVAVTVVALLLPIFEMSLLVK